MRITIGRQPGSASEYQHRRVYDAFISYSHGQDAVLARLLQENLQHFAKPWYRLNSAEIFRDETNLVASPGVWPDIKKALISSQHLILLASTKAAQSKWVRAELAFWLSDGQHENLAELTPVQCSPERAQRLFIVLTDGELLWNDEATDFDWNQSNALPDLPTGTFKQEPLWVDLRWAVALPEQELSRDNPDFMRAVAKLLTPIKNIDIQMLVGQDYAVYRSNLRTAYLAVGGLATLTLALLAATVIVLHLRELSEERARIADSRRLAIEAGVAAGNRQVDHALELALSSYDTEPTVAAQDALVTALQVQPRLERIISMPGRTVSALTYSADGKHLIAGDLHGNIYQIKLGPQPRIVPEKFAQHANSITRIVQTTGGYTLATAEHPDIGVWSSDGQLTKLTGHRNSVKALAHDKVTGAWASGDVDGLIQVRQSLTADADISLKQPNAEVFSLLYLPGRNSELLSGGRGEIYRWRPGEKDTRRSLHTDNDKSQVWEIQAGPDGTVAACDESGAAHIWEPGFSLYRIVKVFTQGCINLRWLDDKRILVSSSGGQLSLLQDTFEASNSTDRDSNEWWKAWQVADTWQAHPGPASALAVRKDGSRARKVKKHISLLQGINPPLSTPDQALTSTRIERAR